MLSTESIEKLRKAIQKELEKIPEFDVERAYDKSYRYERIKLDVNILKQVIFKEHRGVKKSTFSLSELRKLDLSEVDFAGVDISEDDLSYTNANINPQIVAGKRLMGTNLAGLDLKGKDFAGVDIDGANLSNTGADIDPQTVRSKSLKRTNLTGLDLKGKDFTGVRIQGANLSNTGADIDPQKASDINSP